MNSKGTFLFVYLFVCNTLYMSCGTSGKQSEAGIGANNLFDNVQQVDVEKNTGCL